MIFPIYEEISHQFRFRENYSKTETHTIKVPNFTLPSFFFTREKRSNEIEYFEILDLNNTVVATINVSYLQMITSATYDGFGYACKVIKREEDFEDSGYNNFVLPCGFYYIKLTEKFNGHRYYSEIFEAIEPNDLNVKLGGNLVSNSSFNTDFHDWLTIGSWSIISGVATYAGGGGGYILRQPLSNVPANKNRFYSISFTISSFTPSPGAYLRIYTNGLDGVNSVKVEANGEYIFYTNKASDIIIQQIDGAVTFGIDDISVNEILGYDGYVSLILGKDCKFPNSVNPDNFYYYNLILLDTYLLEPQYGEDSTENENGVNEKVLSFVRAYKKWAFNSLLLPEFMVDGMAQLNTFDVAEINSGATQMWYYRNSEMEPERVKSIQNFDVNPEWQPLSCYALVNVSFEETLSLKSNCCDDASDIISCPDLETEVVIEISQDAANNRFHITLSNSPTGLNGSYVVLQYQATPVDDYVDCDTGLSPSSSTISKPFVEFAADGIYFYANDMFETIYRFRLVAQQIGCPDSILSNTVCAIKPALILNSITETGLGANCPANTIRTDSSIALYTGVMLQFFINDGSTGWITVTAPGSVLPSVADGVQVADGIFPYSIFLVTKARLIADDGTLSNELPYSGYNCA
jgi:hypothetical protein